MERMSVCQVEMIRRQGIGPQPSEQSQQRPSGSVVAHVSTIELELATPRYNGARL